MTSYIPIKLNLTNNQKQTFAIAKKYKQPWSFIVKKDSINDSGDIFLLTENQIKKLQKAKNSITITMSKNQLKQQSISGGQFYLEDPTRRF